jgi:CLIP-associating protein 1/2
LIDLDKASPFKTNSPAPATAIEADTTALQSGTPEMRNLQKLTLFSTSHPISAEGDEAIWTEGRLFARTFDGLVAFLRPEKEADLLEHGLVLLWEMVQHQWSLIEGQEAVLVDCLFTLRSSRSATVCPAPLRNRS